MSTWLPFCAWLSVQIRFASLAFAVMVKVFIVHLPITALGSKRFHGCCIGCR
jgi:hypothetical protein